MSLRKNNLLLENILKNLNSFYDQWNLFMISYGLYAKHQVWIGPKKFINARYEYKLLFMSPNISSWTCASFSIAFQWS